MKRSNFGILTTFAFLAISQIAAAEIIWVPISPIVIGPPPSGPPVHVLSSGSTLSVLIPGTLQYDEFGRLVNRVQRLTHFEVVVGPASKRRGCYPASKADKLKNWTGVISPWRNLAPTTKEDTYERYMPGDRDPWTVHLFKINDGVETPISQLNIFFPADRYKGSVPCHFQVNTTSSPDENPQQQAAARAPATAPAAAAAPSAAPVSKKKSLRVESVPEDDSKDLQPAK